MYAFTSLLLTLIFFLESKNIDFVNATLYECDLTAHLPVNTADQGKINIFQPQLTVDVPDHRYSIFTYPRSNTITFRINEIIVNFNGYEKEPEPRWTSPRKVFQAFRDRISGVAQRIEMNSTDSDISDCHVFILPFQAGTYNVSTEIASDIRLLAETCIQSNICLNIGKMNRYYRVGPDNMNGLANLPGLTGRNVYSRSFYGPAPFQNAFNTLIDSGLASLVAGLNATGQSKIHLPKINTHFTSLGGMRVTGQFEALNGTFSDLTALSRKSQSTVSHESMKFTISSKFAIDSAKLKYEYRAKYSNRLSRGEMTATIKAVNLEARFIADYNKTPCITTLDHLKVTDFDKLNSDLTSDTKSDLSGNNWFDKKTLDSIGQTIEQNLRSSTRIRLWYFDCEKFRP